MTTITKAITDKINILNATADRMESFSDDFHMGVSLGIRTAVQSLQELLESLEGRDRA